MDIDQGAFTLAIAEQVAVVASANTILAGTHLIRDCDRYIDPPDRGWT